MVFLRKKPKTIDFTKLPDSRVRQRKHLNISGDCIDLREDRLSDKSSSSVTSAAGSVMDFLGSSGNSGSSSDFSSGASASSFSDYPSNSNEIVELKRMLKASSGRIEDNANEVYRLMQRIELLERKIERLEGRA